MTLKLGVLGSTRGTSMLALIQAIQELNVDARIELVLSDRQEALILQRAKNEGIKSLFIDKTGLTRTAYDQRLSETLMQHRIDLVVLIGYMSILSPSFVAQWRHRIINVHPSLLPAFAGLMDKQVHEAVLASGRKETGCSVHYVTDEVDAGPVIFQKKCSVLPEDTMDTLKERVQGMEGEALALAIQHINQVNTK